MLKHALLRKLDVSEQPAKEMKGSEPGRSDDESSPDESDISESSEDLSEPAEEQASDDSDDDDDDDDNSSDDGVDDGPPTKKVKLNGADQSSGSEVPSNKESDPKNSVDMYHSSLFKLQIAELLNEVIIQKDQCAIIDKFVSELRQKLLSLSAEEKHELSDSSWLSKQDVKLPMNLKPHDVKGTFQFHPPKSVKVIGSYPHKLALMPDAQVDLAVEMPKECFQQKDHLNQRYLRKRGFYLAVLAAKLRRTGFGVEISYCYQHGNSLRPVMVIKPSGSDAQWFTVKLHPHPEDKVFQLNRFHLCKNNIRTQWYTQSDKDGVECTEPATPHYNLWVLQDLIRDENERYASNVIKDSQNILEGIALLKVWLHQRALDLGLGCFSGHIMMMYVVYLLTKRKLNVMMNSFQIFRNTLQQLFQSDWLIEPSTLAADLSSDTTRPLLTDHQGACPVVFVDRTGYYNYCCDMQKITYLRVKHEASLSLQFLTNMLLNRVDSFDLLFLTPVKFMSKYDQCFHINYGGIVKKAITKLKASTAVMDHCGDNSMVISSLIVDILEKALGDRISALDVMLKAPTRWAVTEAADVKDRFKITIGLNLNLERAYSILNKGPHAEAAEAGEFREFWGDVAELRRFQDGTICEAVVWECSTISDRRYITSRILQHTLNRHCLIDKKDITFIGDQLDSLLQLPVSKRKPDSPAGTGEEQFLDIHRSYDDLAKQLRSLKELPLTIHTIQGISPAFRYAEVFPPTPVSSLSGFKCDDMNIKMPISDQAPPPWSPTLQVLLNLETSGKWPDDKDAVQRVKGAFLLKISDLLRENHGLTSQIAARFLDVYKDGYVFRIEIGYKREIMLQKLLTLPNGSVKQINTEESAALERKLLSLPTLTSSLHGLQQQNGSFSGCVRLAKRWVSSHLLLDGHITEEAIEIIVASLYLQPAPYTQTSSLLTGFVQFLTLLSSHDWQTVPLIVNLNDELTAKEIQEIRESFTRNRATLPLMFIATPQDRASSHWTRGHPTPQVLNRLVLLASESLHVTQTLMTGSGKADFKQVFRPPLDPFDVIIHLDSSRLPRMHHALDKAVLRKFPDYDPNQSRMVPVVNYNPALCYLRSLREAYGDLALFWYDVNGGDIIAVLWKPYAFKPDTLKISHIQSKMVSDVNNEGDTVLVPNVPAVLEGFQILGEGIVNNIEARTEKWKV